MRRALNILPLLLIFATPAPAQSGRFGPGDVATPRVLTLALHQWASTTRERTLDIDDLSYLMDPDAVAILLDAREDGRPERRLLHDWFEGLDRIDDEGWLETVYEVKIEQNGRGASAWARYDVRNTADGPVIRNGITNLQMYFDGTRWWGLGWLDVPVEG